jgi:hypothetical protein
MQRLGVGFSQYDWLPRGNDGACFALSSKWAVKTLLGGNINRAYKFKSEEGKAPKKKADKYIARHESYVERATAKAGKIAADQGVKEKKLPTATLFDAVYEAEAELADTWAQAIALKQRRGIVLRSSRDSASLKWWAQGNLTPDTDFALIYSFYYEASTCCGIKKRSGSHSVAFVLIGGEARYFDPNGGEFFFITAVDGGTLLDWLGGVDKEIDRLYVRKGSLEHSVIHHITAA